MKLTQLTSFEAACKYEGLNPKKSVPNFSHLPTKRKKAMEAHAMLEIIIHAANKIANGGKKWNADYDDGNWKYEPRFFCGSSGFRFDDCGAWLSFSDVGSRLSFFDYDTMKHVVTRPKFLKLYKAYIAGK
jgi:hypothetical protein